MPKPERNGVGTVSQKENGVSVADLYEKIQRSDSMQVVQIETVEVTYEPVKSQPEVIVLVRNELN